MATMAGMKNRDMCDSKGLLAKWILGGMQRISIRPKSNITIPKIAGGIAILLRASRCSDTPNKPSKMIKPSKAWPTTTNLERAFLMNRDEILRILFRIIDFKFFIV